MDQPVDAPLGIVAQGVDVRVTLPVFKAIRCGVVLDDEIIPVQYTHGAVRPYFGRYRTKPVVGARYHVPAIAFFLKSGTYLITYLAVHPPTRGPGGKTHPGPIFLWET